MIFRDGSRSRLGALATSDSKRSESLTTSVERATDRSIFNMFHATKFIKNERGAAALEFALVSFPFLIMILFIMFVALAEFFASQIDFATQKAARQVMVGSVQTQATTQTQFRTNYVCSYLPSVIPCSDVIVSLQTVTEAAQPSGYYQFVNSTATALNIPQLDNSTVPFSPGSQGSYEYLQVVYPVTFFPKYIATLVSGGNVYKGSPAFLLVATVAFRNESY